MIYLAIPHAPFCIENDPFLVKVIQIDIIIFGTPDQRFYLEQVKRGLPVLIFFKIHSIFNFNRRTKCLFDHIQDEFNGHIQFEMASSYLYLSMAAWCEEKGLRGFGNWMRSSVPST